MKIEKENRNKTIEWKQHEMSRFRYELTGPLPAISTAPKLLRKP